MKKKENKITLNFISDIRFTEFCVLVFSYIKNILHIDENEFFKIEISLREVINNAILHGNKKDRKKRVHVTFKWSKSRIFISIRDESQDKVDFKTINKQLCNKDLLSCTGRGILIMKSYMDKVEFIPTTQGTEIVMEKRL